MRDRDRRMRTGIALLVTVMTCSRALAVDVSKLPQACQETIAEMRDEKARFAQLGSVMQKSRKAANIPAFCEAARETVTIIKSQSSRVDACVVSLAGSPDVPADAIDQLTRLRAVYNNMLEAAKNTKFDHFHCGLADL